MTKYKNGFKITVKEWDNVVKVFKKDNGNIYSILVKEIEVTDYIKAVMMIKAL